MLGERLRTFYQLARWYEQNGMLGQLSGIDLQQRDRLFQEEYQAIKEKLETLEEEKTRRLVEIDGSALSGVNEGDRLVWDPEAQRMRRELLPYPQMDEVLLSNNQGAARPRDFPSPAEMDGELLREWLLRCAYNGLWSPSGTNWQPMRFVEVSAEEGKELARTLGGSRVPALPGGAILARREYRSLLDDVARVSGYHQDSKAESIDVGIYLLACEWTVVARGGQFFTLTVSADRRESCTARLQDILSRRLQLLYDNEKESLSSRKGTASLVQEEQEKLKGVLQRMAEGDTFVESLFWCWPQAEKEKKSPQPARSLSRSKRKKNKEQRTISVFDRLVEARCSQRVASPERDLEIVVFTQIWQEALKRLPPKQAHRLAYSVFSWHHSVPRQIGESMFTGLYGAGADPVTGRGGRGGYLDHTRLENLLQYIQQTLPSPPEPVRELWVASSKEQEGLAREVALPAAAIPEHFLAFLLAGDRYKEKEGQLIDRRGRPLTIAMFLRLVRHMAYNFGSFFLRFQNTHPITAVLLVQEEGIDPHEAYKLLGRMAAALTFLCRSRGLISIIKSGPIEFAAEAIRGILLDYLEDRVLSEKIEARLMRPLLTFQMGYPLAPSEVVDKGGREPHSGLEERLRDRRVPRARIAQHYFPYFTSV